jgi:hypothetical protein
LDMGIGAKFALIAFGATLITWLLCEAIKLTNVTRFMFGMKAKPATVSRPISQPVQITQPN